MSRTTVAALGLFALAAAFCAPPAAAQTILFEGARVIPGDGGAAIEDGAILVERGLISRVGKKGEIAAPAGANRIDLAGKTVMPAILSTHVHPGFQRGFSYSAANYTRDNILDDLNRSLYFGISSVMSLGVEKGDVMFEMRADQAAGKLGGAKLLIAGRGIGAPNAGPGAAAYANIAYEVTTEAEIRRAVQEQAAKKVDIIKIWVDDRGGRAPRLPIALSRAVIEEGHKAGLKVAAHIFYHDDAMELAAAGVDNFAHLVRDKEMSDALIALMLKINVYQMPNIGQPERGIHANPPPWLGEPYLMGLLRDPWSADAIARIRASYSGRDPAVVTRSQRGYAILQKSVAKLSTAGVKMILGSDTGLEDHPFGFAEQKELQFMAEAGMTPMQVIVAATSRAAEFLALPDRGVLAAGKRADLLVLDANPLDDIRNTRRIAKMYLAGAEVDRAALKASLLRSARN